MEGEGLIGDVKNQTLYVLGESTIEYIPFSIRKVFPFDKDKLAEGEAE